MVPQIVALVETCVLVDIGKNDSNAKAWLASQKEYLGICLISKMEVIQGARIAGNIDTTEMKRLQQMLKAFKPCPELDLVWAYEQFEKLWARNHQVPLADCLIASTSKTLNLPMYATDKHFEVLLGPLSLYRKPY